MNMIKAAVVGVGYLGQYHAQKYADCDYAELVGVYDTNPNRADEIADRYDTSSVAHYEQLIGKVDAVSIATPTPFHFEVAKSLLQAGIHVLIEKPITTTVEQADELIQIAKDNHALLQVGHLERFNNAVKAVSPYLLQPRFIESLRTAPFQLRGTDVNVVLDLMIHDIDIIQSMIQSDIVDIRANGSPIFSSHIDLANARIEFENGCVANVTASRASLKKERRLRIFQSESFLNIDLDHKILKYYSRGAAEIHPGVPEVVQGKIRFDKGDALKDQIEHFLHSIIHNKPAIVPGEDGRKALETAIKITQAVTQNNTTFKEHLTDA
ncbi:MAG: UDP-N-acetyl-D-glucosamine dehydrogenase [Coxiellaceae bacterium]|nr:UDP-N-acetyl-D-glucosamine dehydrogenase [Coxiellaceae bacterium]